MDNDTLRALVIEYRKQGYKFSEIADMLEKEYGIVRSKQSIHGMYTRGINRLQGESEEQKLLDRTDVVNLHALGYNMTDIQNELNKLENDITYHTIRGIVGRELEYIGKVKEGLIFKVADLLIAGKSNEEISESLQYKGIEPTEKGMNDIIVSAYTLIIRNFIVNELVKVYRDTDNREVVKEVIKNIGISVGISEITSRL